MERESSAEEKLISELGSLSIDRFPSSSTDAEEPEASQDLEASERLPSSSTDAEEPEASACIEDSQDLEASDRVRSASTEEAELDTAAVDAGSSEGPVHGEASRESGEASGRSEEASGSALLDLLDEGWFTGNVTGWFPRLFGGGFSLTTIKESPNEAEEQGEEEEGGEGEGERGRTSNAASDLACTSGGHFPSPRRTTSGLRDSSDFNASRGEPPGFDVDWGGGSVGGGSVRWRRTASPYSSEEESVHNGGGRVGRQRRGRSGGRRRAKRSCSAENTRGMWYGEAQQQDGGGTNKGGAASKPARAQTADTVPLRSPVQAAEGPRRNGRFMRTRSVSDYEAKGTVVPSLWDTPPGAKSKPKSLTDADVEELQGFVDLGFKFPQSRISPGITATLPALRLYQAVGSVQQRILSQRQISATAANASAATAPADAGSASVPPTAPTSESGDSDSGSSASLPNESSWSIADPNDNPVDVKNNLRLWAQAVASTVRQTC